MKMFLAAAAILAIGCPASAQDHGHDAAPQQIQPATSPTTSSQVTIETRDAVRLVGIYRDLPGSTVTIILIPMLGSLMNSYDYFAGRLTAEGISSLVYDQRGHGKSTESRSGQISYKDFKDAPVGEWERLPDDVESVVDYLKNHNVPANSIAIVGASIGANAALSYVSAHDQITSMILLSPGEEYRGLNADAAAAKCGKRSLLFVAGNEDSYSAQSTVKLAGLAQDSGTSVTLETYQNRFHGTTLLSEEVCDRLIAWLGTGR